MAQTIIVNSLPEEVRMAVVEDDKLAELVVERGDDSHLVGNIYKGRVQNILPGMQAAFVDIGLDKNAFLYTGDLREGELAMFAKEIAPTKLFVGQEILVQIVKDAVGTKGPKATTHLTLPGRDVVLLPTANYVGISKQIEEKEERERLKALAQELCPPDMGMIIRTAAKEKTSEELTADIHYLTNLWRVLAARAKYSHAPLLLYRDVDLVIRMVRDYLRADVERVVVDQVDDYQRICDLLSGTSGAADIEKVECVPEGDIFGACGLKDAVEAIHSREVELPSGGYLVFDKTEALTVIDVNTGKFAGGATLADTVFLTNMEAAREIMRQVRLRDISGIIIVDFIDMERAEHQEEVLKLLRLDAKKDKTKTNIVGLTGLGLVEMTRKKSRQTIDALMHERCPHCAGTGRVPTAQTIGIQICRRLRELGKSHKNSRPLMIEAHPSIVRWLKQDGRSERLERDIARKLQFKEQKEKNPSAYMILQGEQ